MKGVARGKAVCARPPGPRGLNGTNRMRLFVFGTRGGQERMVAC